MKEGKEKEKYREKARNVERKGWGWSWKNMKSLCWNTSWEVCFAERILYG